MDEHIDLCGKATLFLVLHANRGDLKVYNDDADKKSRQSHPITVSIASYVYPLKSTAHSRLSYILQVSSSLS